ncbi:DUF2336 domain-containing protein [Bradyrhizobium sp. SYSU BS000235]|uniref:DUF2336 domain-containing protein n=1 Tax=Bradyrhizobium sp. SYSU BS000235 TaxID=3411332 RepID=UPI003C7450E2
MPSMSAVVPANLLDELQNVLSHGPVARRVETLHRITDLFIRGEVDYSDEQISLFDDVFHCLIEKIETSAKALLASRLAPIPKAPPQLIQTLAFDDLIEVAAPVLAQSDRLDDIMLIENARSKSQGHLLAISKRKVLSGAVTDVLVERGNYEVVESTVKNPGAEFSENGFSLLVSRAEGNDNLTTCIAMRPSIPRHHYLKLIAKASASVRARLEAINPQASGEISSAIKEVARRASTDASAITEQTVIAHELVKSLFDDGRLDEHQIAKFAKAGQFDETNAALAAMANVPVATVETMMIESRSEGLMILAKVTGLSWSTLKAVMDMRGALSGSSLEDVDEFKRSYETLRASTAQQVLRFHRMRQNTMQAEPI